MTGSRFVHFDGLDAPVLLDGCVELLEPLERIVPAWPFDVRRAKPGTSPCMTVAPAEDGRYVIVANGSGGAKKVFDAVSTICDMIAELSRELLRSNPRVLCLHGAAIDFAGRLVIFPNSRRAGKSTLTACLARLGLAVFSDDFVPISIAGNGRILGLANGICPRLRRPVPEGFSDGFHAWVTANPGPANDRYKYLSLPGLPANCTALPLGAIVMLDRDDSAETALCALDEATAMKTLLHQNFARNVHSETILSMVATLLTSAPLFRLNYSSAEGAAELLKERFSQWSAPAPALDLSRDRGFRQAETDRLHAPRAGFDRQIPYTQAPGVAEVALNGAAYLTDAAGIGIHRLNSGATGIWRLLADPMSFAEVCSVLSEAFPDIADERIEAEAGRTMERFAASGLIVPAVA